MSKLSSLIGKSSHKRKLGKYSPTWFEVRRPAAPTVGTAAELFRKKEQVEAIDERFAPLLKEPVLQQLMERDKSQIPATVDREGYFGEHHFTYWLSGLSDLRMVERIAPQASFKHVLDFGGATGRFARQVANVYPSSTVTVADLNVNHVEWVDRYLGQSVRGVKVSPFPYFPLADRSVTLCVGLSVFTHIDSYETAWLAEIERVLADGGHAVLTIHSEDTWPRLPVQTWLMKLLMSNPEFRNTYRLGEPMPPGRSVFDYNMNSIEHNCNVFMDSEYVHERWGRWFEVVDIVHRAHHDFQAAVVLRKRSL